MNERVEFAATYHCRDCGYRGNNARMVAHVEKTNHRRICLAHVIHRESMGASRA